MNVTNLWGKIMKKGIIVLIALLLVGCQPSSTSLEGRVSTFQLAFIEEANTINEQVRKSLTGLTDEEIQTLLAQVPFEVISTYSIQITEALNSVVPSWKSLDGFNIEYLKNKCVLIEKESEELTFEAFDMTVLVDSTSLNSLYSEIINQLTYDEKHDLNNLFVEESLSNFEWTYSVGSMKLNHAEITIIDFETGVHYQVTYTDKEIRLIALNEKEAVYGSTPLSDLKSTHLDLEITSLVPFELEVPIKLVYTGMKELSELTYGEGETVQYAVKSENGFVPVEEIQNSQVVGRLEVSWMTETEVLQKNYVLFN
jgi:hypothetical protein